MVVRVLIAVILLAASGFYAAELRANRAFEAVVPDLGQIPIEIGDWQGVDLPKNEVEAAVLAADTQVERRYTRSDGTAVWLFVAYFAQQQVNAQIHSPRNCVPGGGWIVESLEPTTLPLEHGVQGATQMRVRRQTQNLDIYYWFQTQAGTVVGEYGLKWDLVKNSLARRPTNAAFIRFHGMEKDKEAISELVALLDGPMGEVLGQTGIK